MGRDQLGRVGAGVRQDGRGAAGRGGPHPARGHDRASRRSRASKAARPSRVLGRLHDQTPRIPFITGWASSKEAVRFLERVAEASIRRTRSPWCSSPRRIVSNDSDDEAARHRRCCAPPSARRSIPSTPSRTPRRSTTRRRCSRSGERNRRRSRSPSQRTSPPLSNTQTRPRAPRRSAQRNLPQRRELLGALFPRRFLRAPEVQDAMRRACSRASDPFRRR